MGTASEAVGLHTSYLTQMKPAFPKLESNQVFNLSIILQLEDRFEHVMVNPKETVDAEIRRALALPENASITATYAAAEVGELTFLDEGVEEGCLTPVPTPPYLAIRTPDLTLPRPACHTHNSHNPSLPQGGALSSGIRCAKRIR